MTEKEIPSQRSNDKYIEIEGKVIEAIRGNIRVETDAGQIVLTKLSGKMKMNKIHILPNDIVKVRLSPYDLSRGIIVHRMKVYDNSY